jgi:hypothetical protein
MKEKLFLVMQINIEFAFYLTDGTHWMYGEVSGILHSPCRYQVGDWVAFPEFGDHFIYGEKGHFRNYRVKVTEIEHDRNESNRKGIELKTFPRVTGIWECKTDDFICAKEALLVALSNMRDNGLSCDVTEEDTIQKPEPGEDKLYPPTTMC